MAAVEQNEAHKNIYMSCVNDNEVNDGRLNKDVYTQNHYGITLLYC